MSSTNCHRAACGRQTVGSVAAVGVLFFGVMAAPASAYFVGSRFLERVGTTDTVLGSSVTWEAGSTHRIRVQFGVFDDAGGPAPAGGFAAWNVGTFDANFGSWTRTPGRLAPFTFPGSPISNGLPLTDPFTSLTQIDNASGAQLLEWLCGPDGQPGPIPEPDVRGLNTWISTYEVTVQIRADLEGMFNVTIGGNTVVLREWRFTPELSTPPDCEAGTPGVAFFGPLLAPDGVSSFTRGLEVQVVIPGPTGALCVLAGVAGSLRRRRAR